MPLCVEFINPSQQKRIWNKWVIRLHLKQRKGLEGLYIYNSITPYVICNM